MAGWDRGQGAGGTGQGRPWRWCASPASWRAAAGCGRQSCPTAGRWPAAAACRTRPWLRLRLARRRWLCRRRPLGRPACRARPQRPARLQSACGGGVWCVVGGGGEGGGRSMRCVGGGDVKGMGKEGCRAVGGADLSTASWRQSRRALLRFATMQPCAHAAASTGIAASWCPPSPLLPPDEAVDGVGHIAVERHQRALLQLALVDHLPDLRMGRARWGARAVGGAERRQQPWVRRARTAQRALPRGVRATSRRLSLCCLAVGRPGGSCCRGPSQPGPAPGQG
jgi:hypothetical protein